MEARRQAIRLVRAVLSLSGLVATALLPQQAAAAGVTYYVSRNGNNGDGRSWSSAWNELDQIDWNVIQPGDTIIIDGGATPCSYPVVVTGSSNTPGPANCGMVYHTELTLGKS